MGNNSTCCTGLSPEAYIGEREWNGVLREGETSVEEKRTLGVGSASGFRGAEGYAVFLMVPPFPLPARRGPGPPRPGKSG